MTYGYASYGYGAARVSRVPPPILALNFLANEVLDARITASGGANGTRTNNAGVIVAATTPRYDYDPVTLAAKGILIEEARTNLVLNSGALDSANWIKAGATIAANVLNSPAGTLTADKLVESSLNEVHQISSTIAAAASTPYTTTWFLRPAGRTDCQMQLTGAAGNVTANFNLITGTNTYLAPYNGWTNPAYTIAPAGGGWFRVSLTGTTPVGLTSLDTLFILYNAGAPGYLGDGVSGMHMWGAGIEAGLFPTSHIPTAAASVARTADLLTMTGTNFSSWFNATEGSFQSAFDLIGFSSANQRLLAAYLDANNYLSSWLWSGAATLPRFTVQAAAVQQADLLGAAIALNTALRWAAAYKLNNFGFALAGAGLTPDLAGNVPAGLTRLNLGNFDGFAEVMNGHLRNVSYWNTRLTDKQLLALSR